MRSQSGRRTGGALLIAVALMALAAALLVGAAASARSVARAAKSHEAAVIADAESRVVIAGILQSWTPADSLVVGMGRVGVVGPRTTGWGGAVVVTKIRVHRLSQRHYVIATDCQVGPDSAVVARRRMRLVLERAASSDSTLPFSSPAPLGQWSLSDLFL